MRGPRRLSRSFSAARTCSSARCAPTSSNARSRNRHGAGLELEDGLLDRIFDDVGTEPGSLPLLETALLETWTPSRGNLLTLEGYEAVGRRARRGRAPRRRGLRADVVVRAGRRAGHLPPARGARHRAPTTCGAARRSTSSSSTTTHATCSATLSNTASSSPATHRRGRARGAAPGVAASARVARGGPRRPRVHHALTTPRRTGRRADRDDDLLFHGTRLAAALDVADAHPEAINPVERDFLGAATRAEKELRHRAADFSPAPPADDRHGCGPGGGTDHGRVLARPAIARQRQCRPRRGTGDDRGGSEFAAQSRNVIDEEIDLGLLLGVEARPRSRVAGDRRGARTCSS